MPELPDIELYLHALRPRIAGRRLERIRLASPFLVRSVDPRDPGNLCEERESASFDQHPRVGSFGDIIGDPASCVFDSGLTQAAGSLVKVFGWYDNEWGYTCRLADLAAMVGAQL